MEKRKNSFMGEIKTDVDLKNYSTFKVSCIAKYFCIPKDEEDLILLLKSLKKINKRYVLLGNGSNVLFASSVFDGVIISLEKLNTLEIQDDFVYAGAGLSLIGFSTSLSLKGYKNFEFLTGIPGSVGASVCMNVGAHQQEISSLLSKVKVLTHDFKIQYYKPEELSFSYRNSFFKQHKDFICLGAQFKLEKGNVEDIQKRIQEYKERRQRTQPLEFPSAGSVFQNPEGYTSGKLIEQLGFKKYKVGDAEVSEKHANFIINRGNATGHDIETLIQMIQKAVKKEYGMDLKLEIEIIK